jgi:pyruvate-ferredoxin/flavodoxin oxidoreductase
MQPRVKQHVAYLQDVIARLETHIRLKLAERMDLSDPAAISRVITDAHDTDLTLSKLSASLDPDDACSPVDQDWFAWVTQLLTKLRHLHWQYTQGTTGTGRSRMGMINSTGCTSVWGSTFPFNPYPFPWANHLFQDSASMAMGVFEGHMAKMADGFKAVRMAELELEGKYNEEEQKGFFTYFNWRHFNDDELHLCPPVVAVGGDGAMYDIGFQNLSRMMMSGKPIKVFILDTQVYSNTGGQACTSGFTGQVSDMAQFGKAFQGKEEIRKEIGLIAMAHRTTYVMQGAVSHVSHLIESFIEGLNSRRPALFNVYSPCMPEHGIGDDTSDHQSRMAVESRAYPIFRYNPDAGVTAEECFELEGNPDLEENWLTYPLAYEDEDGNPGSIDVPLTFADFAVTEGRFRKQFRTAPRDTWNENMVPLAEFLELEPEDREDLFPYIWFVDRNNRLLRVIPAQPVVLACEERLAFWKMLKGLAGVDKSIDPDAIAEQVRAEMATKLAASLMQMTLGGDSGELVASLAVTPGTGNDHEIPADPGAGDNGYVAPWIDSADCTACDECTELNSKIFAYNDKKQAYIKDPKGGPYKDIVRAAEKCTAKVIHPGLPSDRTVKGIDKLIKRAEKFN